MIPLQHATRCTDNNGREKLQPEKVLLIGYFGYILHVKDEYEN